MSTFDFEIFSLLHSGSDFIGKENNYPKTQLKDFVIPHQKDDEVFPLKKDLHDIFARNREQLFCRNQGISSKDDLSSFIE